MNPKGEGGEKSRGWGPRRPPGALASRVEKLMRRVQERKEADRERASLSRGLSEKGGREMGQQLGDDPGSGVMVKG